MGVNRTDWFPFVFFAGLNYLSDFLINIPDSQNQYFQPIKSNTLPRFHYLQEYLLIFIKMHYFSLYN